MRRCSLARLLGGIFRLILYCFRLAGSCRLRQTPSLSLGRLFESAGYRGYLGGGKVSGFIISIPLQTSQANCQASASRMKKRKVRTTRLTAVITLLYTVVVSLKGVEWRACRISYRGNKKTVLDCIHCILCYTYNVYSPGLSFSLAVDQIYKPKSIFN